jgi:hypothetical protein
MVEGMAGVAGHGLNAADSEAVGDKKQHAEKRSKKKNREQERDEEEEEKEGGGEEEEASEEEEEEEDSEIERGQTSRRALRVTSAALDGKLCGVGLVLEAYSHASLFSLSLLSLSLRAIHPRLFSLSSPLLSLFEAYACASLFFLLSLSSLFVLEAHKHAPLRALLCDLAVYLLLPCYSIVAATYCFSCCLVLLVSG